MPLTPALSAAASKAVGAFSGDKNSYSPIAENWYKSLPYAFVATDASGLKKIFYLPLNPSNISVVTHFATNVIATVGGTVEEHAPQRYFDISIAGTTGIAPQNVSESTSAGNLAFSVLNAVTGIGLNSTGRQTYTPEPSLGQYTGGFFAKTVGALDNTINAARDVLAGARTHEAGFSAGVSGYMAFHNFYRFLLESKRNLQQGEGGSLAGRASSAINSATKGLSDRTGVTSKIQPLKFISYKDNTEYTCAITRFELTRSSDSPMLYNYSIQLKAYKLSSVGDGGQGPAAVDRLAALGLGGKPTLLSTIKGKANAAKRGISAVRSLGRNAGR